MSKFKTSRNPQSFQPLVSVLVYNYNYGKYLSECFDSILEQTYPNIEIIFSDNASTDDSWDIACKYAKENPDKIHIARNRKNFGADANLLNCHAGNRGNYYCIIGSDDVLAPTYVETLVNVMLNDTNIAFVMTHRYIIDALGNRTDEPPFYDGNYKLFPPSQNTVYMMAAVNPSVSQIMYRPDTPDNLANIFNGKFYSARIQDFLICLQYPVAYLSVPLLGHRIHGENQSLIANDNLMEVIGPYVLAHQFAELGRQHNYTAIEEKYDDAVAKTGALAVRYASRALLEGNVELFERYLALGKALYPSITSGEDFKALERLAGDSKATIKQAIEEIDGLQFGRRVSYKPNEPFEILHI